MRMSAFCCFLATVILHDLLFSKFGSRVLEFNLLFFFSVTGEFYFGTSITTLDIGDL